MENKPNNEISELLARLQKSVEKESEEKEDSVTPRNEESTEALLSLLKKSIGVEKEERPPSRNEDYDIQGYEFEEEPISEPINEKVEEIVEPTVAEPLNESISYSKEDEEILHSRVAELVNDSLEADEMLELLLRDEENTESVTPVVEDTVVSPEAIDADLAEETDEQMPATFGEESAKGCLHESTAKRFFGEKALENMNDEPDAADFDDVDINLALALGSRETLEESVGYFRVRSAKNGFYDPFWEEATADNTYGYCGEEFRSYKQVDAIKQRYEQKRRNLKKRFVVTFLLSVLILFLEHMPFTSLNIPYFSEWMALPIFYYGLAVLFSLLLVLVSLKSILRGIRSLFLLRAEPFVPVAFLTVLNFAYTLVLFLFVQQGELPVYNFAIAIFLLLGMADDGMRLAREKHTFDVVSEPKTKLSLERFEGNTETNAINAFSSKNDFFVEKSDFVGNFFTRSGRRPAQFSECFHELAFSALGSLLVSLVALCLEQSVLSAFTMFVFSLLVCVPMQFLTLGIYPFFRLTKGLSKLDSAVIGDAVTDEYNDADTIYLEDTEMFGKHGARIVGLRVYNDMEFYDILSYALSVFTVVGAPLCNVFDNSAREIEKKEGVRITGISVGGIEASVENEKTVDVGNLAYMRSRGYFPKRNPDDEKKIESGEICILYMAIDGQLCAKIYMQYTVTKRFEKFAAEMIRNGIHVGIRTLDPNVNEKMIAALRKDDKMSIKVIRPTPNELIPIGKHSDSGIVTSKNSHMIFKILEQCFNIKRIHSVQRKFRVGALLLGVIVSFLLMIWKLYTSIPSLYIVIYQLLWLLPSLIYTKSKLK